MDHKLILSIAKNTRKQIVKIVTDNPTIYSDVSPMDLSCACGMASTLLLLNLKKAGIADVRICEAPYHVFVMVEDHILDITATQFSGFEDKPLVFMEWMQFKLIPKVHDEWKYKKTFSDAKKFHEYQMFHSDWPTEQTLTTEDFMKFCES